MKKGLFCAILYVISTVVDEIMPNDFKSLLLAGSFFILGNYEKSVLRI